MATDMKKNFETLIFTEFIFYLLIIIYLYQNKSLHSPQPQCLLNCLKEVDSFQNKENGSENFSHQNSFRISSSPQLPLNRFSKAVHNILDNNILHGQTWASLFHFLILRISIYVGNSVVLTFVYLFKNKVKARE